MRFLLKNVLRNGEKRNETKMKRKRNENEMKTRFRTNKTPLLLYGCHVVTAVHPVTNKNENEIFQIEIFSTRFCIMI